jgi:hypothetical protein
MEQADFLRHSADTLDRLGVPYMVVGSFACMAYGEARFTQDIDIVLDLPLPTVSAFCAAYPPPDFFLSEHAVRDAVRTRFQFNVLHPASGNKIDFILPRADEWGKARMNRRQGQRLIPDRDVFTASPEDVIVGKLWYYSEGGSDKHLRDIAGILRVSGDQVDRADVTAWATKLGYLDLWERVQKSVDDPNHPKV